jgi:predicted Zn-dependent peptidase
MANMENNAIALAKNMLRLGRVESLEQTCNRINSVTPELINKVANEVFNKELLKTVIIQ